MTSTFTWCYYENNTWVPFNSDTQSILEHGYINSRPSVGYLSDANHSHTVDLLSLLQTNLSTKSQSEIDRVETITGPNGTARTISLKAQYLIGLTRKLNSFSIPSSLLSDTSSSTSSVSTNTVDPVWEYLDGHYRPYHDSAAIETLYQQAGQNGRATYSSGTLSYQYQLDFGKMTQTNASTQGERKIRRTP